MLNECVQSVTNGSNSCYCSRERNDRYHPLAPTSRDDSNKYREIHTQQLTSQKQTLPVLAPVCLEIRPSFPLYLVKIDDFWCGTLEEARKMEDCKDHVHPKMCWFGAISHSEEKQKNSYSFRDVRISNGPFGKPKRSRAVFPHSHCPFATKKRLHVRFEVCSHPLLCSVLKKQGFCEVCSDL